LLLATMVPLGQELDLAAHQGVVCIAVRAVVRACVENVLNGGSSDQNEIQLVPVFKFGRYVIVHAICYVSLNVRIKRKKKG